MTNSYLRHYQDHEDEVEGGAYLLWRRFSRLGLPNDVLTIPLTERFPTLFSEEGDLEAIAKKLVFREFTNEEMALLQFGRLVALKEKSFTESQQSQWTKLRDYFIGREVIVDYYNSLMGHVDYDPLSVMQVAVEYHGEEGEVTGRIDDVNMIYSLASASKGKPLGNAFEPGEQISDVPELRGLKSHDEVLEFTSELVRKIDELLLTMM